MNRQLRSTICILINCAVIGVCLIAALYVCAHKDGFHEDEYYTYYSSNRTDGFWLADSTLMDRQTILNEFSVVKGEGFDFALVKEVQSWDVHPPVYYFLIHFICSLTPGRFSIWQGLILNLVCYTVSIVLVMRLVKALFTDNEYAPAVVALIFGLSAASLTSVVFIRMYMLLTVWVLALTILHVNYLQNENKRKYTFYIKLGILSFLGFMTHYYFFIWLFFLAVCFNLYELIKTRKWIGIIKYAATMVVTFGVSYLFYPAWPAQMFKGQRGAQATGNFFDISNTLERIGFFADKVNRIGFGRILWVLIPVLAVFGIVDYVKTKKAGKEALHKNSSSVYICIILLVAAVLYFLTVSKTALMLGDSSIRYQMPVLGVVIAAISVLMLELLGRISVSKHAVAAGIVAVVMLICNLIADFSGGISFLYPEEKEHMAILNGSSNAGIIYIYNEDPSQSWCVWDSANELLAFDKVLFLSADATDKMSDEAIDYIGSKDTLFTYVDSSVDITSIINREPDTFSDLSTQESSFLHEYCDVYILSK